MSGSIFIGIHSDVSNKAKSVLLESDDPITYQFLGCSIINVAQKMERYGYGSFNRKHLYCSVPPLLVSDQPGCHWVDARAK